MSRFSLLLKLFFDDKIANAIIENFLLSPFDTKMGNLKWNRFTLKTESLINMTIVTM